MNLLLNSFSASARSNGPLCWVAPASPKETAWINVRYFRPHEVEHEHARGKYCCREVGMRQRNKITGRRNRNARAIRTNGEGGRDERALTNSTPTRKDVVLPAWIADQLDDVELVVVVCNVCLRTMCLSPSKYRRTLPIIAPSALVSSIYV